MQETLQAPDFGADSASIIEIFVEIGQTLEIDDPLITIESDKASVEIPATSAGVIQKILVKVGDQLRVGQDIIEIKSTATATTDTANIKAIHPKPPPAAQPANQNQTYQDAYDVAIIGAGPAGYTAAFRAADLGLKVALIEKYETLGGVCLNVGCIPSKALLHTAQIIHESSQLSEHGVHFNKAKIDIQKLRQHTQAIIDELTTGLAKMAKLRKLDRFTGRASFVDANSLQIDNQIDPQKDQDKPQTIHFKHAIIAAGSRVIKPSFVPDHPLVWDSTDALELRHIPKRLMVLGGGIIGLEMATVYHALGSQITIVELGPQLIPEADKDMVLPLQRRLKSQYQAIYTNTKASHIEAKQKTVTVSLEGAKAPAQEEFDAVLVAIGRVPNGHQIGVDRIGVEVDQSGFIGVDAQQRTNISHIFAIGDIVGQPMLAHKATHQAKVAAETIAAEKVAFNPMSIPSVAYTHPEVAWIGKTEKQLKQQGFDYYKGLFPWQASGRALSCDGRDGLSKALFCSKTKRLIGAAVTGPNAGDVICEAILALEMGATDEDIGLTIHPHPTLGETLAMAAEAAAGTITDLMPAKKR